MKILTASQLREIDRLTTEEYGVPQAQLMEAAGLRVVETLDENFEDLESLDIVVLCGKGNNGGDGLVVARHLHERGCDVDVFLMAKEQEYSGAAAEHLQKLKAAGLKPRTLRSEKAPDFDAYDIVIDAMLGTGTTRPVEGLYKEVIGALSMATEPEVVSIDIPSGLAADSSEPIGDAVMADMTVTFTALKPCLVLPPAHTFAGDVTLSEIGTPQHLLDSFESSFNLISVEDFAGALPIREDGTHKGDYGRILIAGGSRGKSGAAVMAGQAAMRSGAGLVTVAVPESVLPIVAASMPELMTEPLRETARGSAANQSISDLLEGKSVLAIGPGMGTHPETQDFIRDAVRASIQAGVPVIIDADGLNAFAGGVESLRGDAGCPIVITPHPGEMARLVGKDVDFINSNRIEIARSFAVEHEVYVVLKGFRTVIGCPDSTVYVNGTGNPGMATAGMGDILTGMIAGLLGQKRLGSFSERLYFAVHLHGAAGDEAAAFIGEEPLIATDILDFIGAAWEKIRE